VTETTDYTDTLLLLQIKEGDEKAFRLLFERYRNQLFTYLFRITKSKEAAEEMVLDVFLKIWLGRSIITEIQYFEGFLFRIAHNKAIDFLRTVAQQPAKQEALWASMQETPASETADQRLELNRAQQTIHEAIEHLPGQQQNVFVLSREQGLTYDKIAEKLHLSRHTVRNHMAAALEFIRLFLQEKGYGITLLSLVLNKTF
jgi:RNA polymerase sigma-70 factor (ECF subfamily)